MGECDTSSDMLPNTLLYYLHLFEDNRLLFLNIKLVQQTILQIALYNVKSELGLIIKEQLWLARVED